jgi:hypothetical protein
LRATLNVSPSPRAERRLKSVLELDADVEGLAATPTDAPA